MQSTSVWYERTLLEGHDREAEETLAIRIDTLSVMRVVSLRLRPQAIK